MESDNTTNQMSNDSAGPVLQEKVERDTPSTLIPAPVPANTVVTTPKKKPVVKKVKAASTKDAPVPPSAETPAAPVPKKRHRRTREEIARDNAKLLKKTAAKKSTPVTPVTTAPAKAEAPKKRHRRTRDEIARDNALLAAGKPAASKKAPPKATIDAPVAPVATKKAGKKGPWRKGRVWPEHPVSIYIVEGNAIAHKFEKLTTKKPRALAVALKKMLWHYTTHPSPTGKKKVQ